MAPRYKELVFIFIKRYGEEVRTSTSTAHRRETVSAHCRLTGRKPAVGNSISHSHRHTRRRFVDGRPRGHLRAFGISRIRLCEMARAGELLGVRESSW
ncbi:L28 family ribosomal protein [Streptomyces humicola]|uniref:L28 family ribosomal protein n=1 Tax=Streptomyces humicola TaxID=2953240 RepID=UPI00210BE17F|nr:L28 family ribosomal protein [Streptomyces humicola]